MEYNRNLKGTDFECPSDIYSGVTNYSIKGDYTHFNSKNYWYSDSGARKHGTNEECFAEYFGYAMINDKVKRRSIEEFLPKSLRIMDEMTNTMAERGR